MRCCEYGLSSSSSSRWVDGRRTYVPNDASFQPVYTGSIPFLRESPCLGAFGRGVEKTVFFLFESNKARVGAVDLLASSSYWLK